VASVTAAIMVTMFFVSLSCVFDADRFCFLATSLLAQGDGQVVGEAAAIMVTMYFLLDFYSVCSPFFIFCHEKASSVGCRYIHIMVVHNMVSRLSSTTNYDKDRRRLSMKVAGE
jgi:hypothetical protein